MEPLERMEVEDPHVLPVKQVDTMKLREAVKPANRELDKGGAVWAAVAGPVLGGLGYLVEHLPQLEAALRLAGVPEGTVALSLLGLGVVYAAVTRARS